MSTQMEPISIEQWLSSYVRLNPRESRAEVEGNLCAAVQRKRLGARCINCGAPIWAIGRALAGWRGCFACITGEVPGSEAYEIDEVCDL